MEPKIVERDQMILVGHSFYGDPFAESAGWTEENEIGRLWNRFMTYAAEQRDAIQHVVGKDVAYEVHVETPETSSKGFREVFVGVEVEHLASVPVDLLVKVLPAATYVCSRSGVSRSPPTGRRALVSGCAVRRTNQPASMAFSATMSVSGDWTISARPNWTCTCP